MDIALPLNGQLYHSILLITCPAPSVFDDWLVCVWLFGDFLLDASLSVAMLFIRLSVFTYFLLSEVSSQTFIMACKLNVLLQFWRCGLKGVKKNAGKELLAFPFKAGVKRSLRYLDTSYIFQLGSSIAFPASQISCSFERYDKKYLVLVRIKYLSTSIIQFVVNLLWA